MPNATTKVAVATTPWGDDGIKRIPAATATTYYSGAMIALNALGNAVKCDNTAGIVFDGINKNSAKLTINSDDTLATMALDHSKQISVERPFRFAMYIAAAVEADIGRPVYAAFDNEVSLSTTAGIHVGWIDQILSSTSVLIKPAYAGGGTKVPIMALTASYTINVADSGKFITTRGASGAVVVTLPTVSTGFAGVEFSIFNAVDQDLTLTAQTNGQIMFKNDVAANSVAYSTAAEKIGGAFRAVCDGTSWLVMPLAEEAQTITVAT